jgi:hypothetical protein
MISGARAGATKCTVVHMTNDILMKIVLLVFFVGTSTDSTSAFNQ